LQNYVNIFSDELGWNNVYYHNRFWGTVFSGIITKETREQTAKRKGA